MAGPDWIFWKVSDHGGELLWLGITRPRARSAVDRVKFWTLIPKRRFFIANWYVTEDHLRSPGGTWSYENIEIAEAREILTELPDVAPEDLARITPAPIHSDPRSDRPDHRSESDGQERRRGVVGTPLNGSSPQLIKAPLSVRLRNQVSGNTLHRHDSRLS